MSSCSNFRSRCDAPPPPRIRASALAQEAGRHWMLSDMTKHENIAKALRARLSELTNHVVEIDSELRKPLSADLEEQATDLENQDARLKPLRILKFMKSIK